MMFDGGETAAYLAVSILVLAAFLFLRRSKPNGVEDGGKRHPPSLPVLPFIGAILRGGMTEVPKHFMRSAEQIGPVFSVTLGNRKLVILNGYESIFDALVRHSEAFSGRNALFTEEKVINHGMRGIIFAHYSDAYKKYHKLSLSILKEFGCGLQMVTEMRVLQEVESMNDEILKQNGRPFNPKWLMVYSTSNFILSMVFGKSFQQTLPKENMDIVEGSAECIANFDLTLNMAPFVRFLPMFRKTIEGLKSSSERLMKGIEAGIKFNKSNNSEPTFVGRFLEIEGSGYNHQDLQFVLRDLSFGSTDTMATTLQWAMIELANHRTIQNRLQKEIDEMVPGERLPSLDDKPRLPYTEAVILEVMRLRTVLPLLVPHATLKDTKVLHFDVPKGSMIIPNCYSAHMDPKFWKDPENFRPERFLDKDNKVVDSQRVIPFGLGKRSCMGEIVGRPSTFLFLTSLVQRFDIRPPEGQQTINVKEHSAITTTPAHFEVRLIPRVKPTQS